MEQDFLDEMVEVNAAKWSHFWHISGILARKRERGTLSQRRGKAVMRMTLEEFHAWSQRLQFTSETEALIAAIRSSPPVRRRE